jgi:hypothetical protein
VRLIIVAMLVLTVAGCTAPGEPPSHPSTADYHDLMRRETGKATSTVATMQAVVGELRRGRIPQNYATVMTRQSVADLTSVATDLRQITAPSAVASVIRNWDQPARLAHTTIHLSAAERRLAKLSRLL